MNNYERIKNMSFDEMAEFFFFFFFFFLRAVIEGFKMALGIELTGEVPIEVSIKNQRQWLQQEVSE